MKTTNYSDLRKNLASYMDEIIAESQPLLITRHGAKPVVMMPLDLYAARKLGIEMQEPVSTSFETAPSRNAHDQDAVLAQLDARIAKSLAQAQAGLLIPAEEVFASIGLEYKKP
jgi:PHD/YefM family antitoxin component YafN of YafNO toxin-antitoxin module